jgi:hypothetical protein
VNEKWRRRLKNVVFYFDFGFVANRRSYGVRFCRFLSRGKVQRQSAVQSTQGSKVFILELGMMVEKGE